jgi:HSP20 family protein
MGNDLIHLMHSLFLPAREGCREACWCPPADIYRTREGWTVKLDLAGVKPEDVRISAQGRRLKVCGSRRDCSVTEGCSMYQMEISYSQFSRELELPCEVESAELALEYRDGMLFIQIQEPARAAQKS